MRKKRKGSEIVCSNKTQNVEASEPRTHDLDCPVSKLKSHYSLEDYSRLRKRCKEDVGVDGEGVGSSKNARLALIAATAPPCGASSSVSSARGHKRKIGCIEACTQMGRKHKIEGDYSRGENIGRGKFGSVWLCMRRTTGEEFACKTLQKGEETVHREVEIMQHLSGHPGVVTLKGVYEEDECFHLVMELCSGGRLIDDMTKEETYSEHRAANIFRDLLSVIKYCHEMGVVHRDIKPENILLTSSGKIKLADFGLAMRIADGQKLSGVAGSPAYLAPEVMEGDYSEKVDVWSAGVLLHALLVGTLPFKGQSLDAVFDSIKNTKLDFHSGQWESVSKPARDLLERILTRDATARISADEVLRHPWILFYTERSLKTLYAKPKSKHQPGIHAQVLAATRPVVERDETDNPRKKQLASFDSSHRDTEEQDDSDFIDALTVAISHVHISPKRSRVCVSSSPIREQCSSNMNANLCKAF